MENNSNTLGGIKSSSNNDETVMNGGVTFTLTLSDTLRRNCIWDNEELVRIVQIAINTGTEITPRKDRETEDEIRQNDRISKFLEFFRHVPKEALLYEANHIAEEKKMLIPKAKRFEN